MGGDLESTTLPASLPTFVFHSQRLLQSLDAPLESQAVGVDPLHQGGEFAGVARVVRFVFGLLKQKGLVRHGNQ